MAKQSKSKKGVKEAASAIHIHEEAVAAASDPRSAEPSRLNKSEEIRRLARDLQAR